VKSLSPQKLTEIFYNERTPFVISELFNDFLNVLIQKTMPLCFLNKENKSPSQFFRSSLFPKITAGFARPQASYAYAKLYSRCNPTHFFSFRIQSGAACKKRSAGNEQRQVLRQNSG
jgi:hypothetical protein